MIKISPFVFFLVSSLIFFKVSSQPTLSVDGILIGKIIDYERDGATIVGINFMFEW